MKIFSGGDRPPRSKRAAAINCLLINQFATPGLGSLMGGRIFAGLIQLAMALVGFVLFLLWMLDKFAALYRQLSESPTGAPIRSWMGWTGLILFGGSWILSWFTSLSLLRNAPKTEPESPNIPPIIPPPKI